MMNNEEAKVELMANELFLVHLTFNYLSLMAGVSVVKDA